MAAGALWPVGRALLGVLVLGVSLWWVGAGAVDKALAGVAAAVVHGVATLVAVSSRLVFLSARYAPPVPAGGGPTTNPVPPYAGRAGLAHG